MDRRMRRRAARAALVAAAAATLSSAALAVGDVTTDMPWDLNETLATYGSTFHISSGTDGAIAFRWIDSPTKLTVVSANACSDWSLLGASQTIGAGDTDYHSLYTGFAGQCFVMRGRTGSGTGAMSGKTGRVRRCPMACSPRRLWPSRRRSPPCCTWAAGA